MITKINPCNGYGSKQGKNISFGVGKIELFSDFDNTYCPISHAAMKTATPVTHHWFSEYCENFKKFFNNTRDGLKFHLTSGRSFGEYESISDLIKARGFELPLPDTFIAKNGSDEHIRIGTEEDFYKKGIFPFRYDKTNIEKENKIKELTGWDGPKIKEKLKELLKEKGFRIVEGDSEQGTGDYGMKSLFAEGKLPYETKKIPGKDKFEWVAGLRNDGNCKLFVTYPPDVFEDIEKTKAYSEIQREMKKNLMESKTKFRFIKPKKKTKECGGRVCNIFEPLVDKKSKYNIELTKLYDTKEAVKKAIKNNDLVIVAGDGSNDLSMLNPLSYINVPPEVYKDNLLPDWENNPLHKNIAKQIDDLPFMGIVVDRKDSKLRNIAEAFGPGNRFNKIICVKNGELEDGIKDAVQVYCLQHPEYAEKLNPDLKKEIFGTADDISPILREVEQKLERAKIEAKSAKDASLRKELQRVRKSESVKEVMRSVKETATDVTPPQKNEEVKSLTGGLKEKISGIADKVKNNPQIKYLALGALAAGVILATILCVKKFTGRKKSITPSANPLPSFSNVPKCFSEISNFAKEGN